MYGEDVAIVAIVFGSVISIVFLGIVGSIIKAAIKRKSGNLAENKEFINALREFKEKTDRRLSNLESIVADEKPPYKQPNKETGDPKKKSAIEIELENHSSKDQKQDSGKLRNMLNQ